MEPTMPAAAPDFALHSFRSADGRLTLSARIYPAEPGAPDLLLMHGLTRNAADFEPLAAWLAGRYRLIVPDQRGRGLSAHDPDPENYRPDVYAADMLALIDGLGIAHATLVGTSMGGLVAMVMSALRPAAIDAVVLNDVGPVLEPAGLERIQGYVGPSPAMSSWEEAAARCRAANAEAFPDFGGREWRAFAKRTCRKDRDAAIRFAYDPAIAQSIAGADPATVPPDLWPLWQLMDSLPVLVLRGSLSDLISAATVDEMARLHSAPFVSVEVPRVGHAPLLDEPAARTAIAAFLSAHARPA